MPRTIASVADVREQLLTGARTADDRIVDLRIDGDGRIASVVNARQGVDHRRDDLDVIDLREHLLVPAAVEPHAHLDKAFLAEKIPNPTGDLVGAVDAMRTHRHLLDVEETVERAERAARWMASNGFVAVRTHVDVTIEHGLTSVEALSEVRRRVADTIDIELVALVGWPVTGPAGAEQRALAGAAIDAGADVLGGCPHLESLRGDGTIEDATDVLLHLAVDRGLAVDLHTDETLDPSVTGLAHLAGRVLEGFPHAVTASHCVSLGQQSDAVRSATIESVAEAGISVVSLPHTNLYLQGRNRSPMPRGLTSVRELLERGVNVAAGADNLQDPFNPLGRACPFETAGLMILTSHLLPDQAWNLVSARAAAVLGRPAGLEAGLPADLLALRVDSLREAIAGGTTPVHRWRAGHRTDAPRRGHADGAETVP